MLHSTHAHHPNLDQHRSGHLLLRIADAHADTPSSCRAGALLRLLTQISAIRHREA
jgi:cell division FtsZ-interacting protein ZapD